MRGSELYGIREKWQQIAVNNSLLCRMEAQVVWLDLLSGEFATCLELKSRTWRDFRGLSGLRPLAPLSARRGLECIKHDYRARGGEWV